MSKTTDLKRKTVKRSATLKKNDDIVATILMHLKNGSLELLLINQTITETLEISRRKKQINNDNKIRRKIGYTAKRLLPSCSKLVDQLRKSTKGKDDPMNNSRKPANRRIIFGRNPGTSKEAVNYGDKTNESVPPSAVSKTIEEDHNVHQSTDLNRSKVPKTLNFVEVSATVSLSKKPETVNEGEDLEANDVHIWEIIK